MTSLLDPWLSCLAFAAIVIAMLAHRLQQRNDTVAWILIGYFCICFVLIFIKWYLRLDLAVYDIEKYQSASTRIATLLKADFLGNLPYIIQPYAAYTIPLGLLNFIFGDSQLPGQLLNTVMGLGVILNMHRSGHLVVQPQGCQLHRPVHGPLPLWLDSQLHPEPGHDDLFLHHPFFLFPLRAPIPGAVEFIPLTVGLGPGQFPIHGTAAPATSDPLRTSPVYLLDYQS